MSAHDSWADYYDCVYKLKRGDVYHRFTDQTLGVIRNLEEPPARIVEFGAGTGRLAIPLAQMGYRVTAVEASAEMCRVLRAKAASGVEGAVVAPCVGCKRTTVPIGQRHPVEVDVRHQSICQFLPHDRFDLGLCVFTVLNYIVEEEAIRDFAKWAAYGIHPGGKLLVSFVENMAPLMDLFNGQPKIGHPPDGRCSMVRNINIRPAQEMETLFEYDEQTTLTKDGRRFRYSDEFSLREWSREQIVRTIETDGFFRMERDLTDDNPGTGEVYLLFSRDATSTKIDARADIYELVQQERVRVSKFLDGLPKRKVFFYPGCGSDIEPLFHFTGQCDAFVFCDHREIAGNWNESKFIPPDRNLKFDSVTNLGRDVIDVLGLESRVTELFGLEIDHQRVPAHPWGKLFKLIRTIGDDEYHLDLLYLGMEAATAYFNLFTKNAPAGLPTGFFTGSNGHPIGSFVGGNGGGVP